MIIRNHTTNFFWGSLTALFFYHQLKIILKAFGKYNQNDYLCSVFIVPIEQTLNIEYTIEIRYN